MNFKDFNFKHQLMYGLSRAGFREPSPIQEKTIPLILEGKDVVGQAHTGTGKTAAFTLPILEKMEGKRYGEVVILVPTRELASQVAREFYRFSRNLNINTAAVYGGVSYGRQIEHIKKSGVIVATPGRFLDLLDKGLIQISPRFVVLDEADEMLNMGFLDDIRLIFQFLNTREQTLMFSATLPDEIKTLAESFLRDAVFVRTEEESTTNNSIDQYYYLVEEHEKDESLLRLIETTNPKKAIIFCRTKRETDRLAQFLLSQGFRVAALHGDIEQWERQKIMKSFRFHEYELLVATDVAARGLDIRGISHIFNYHIPFEAESYVHRIGRTGRAKRSGVAMTLVTPYELKELEKIKESVGSHLQFARVPMKQSSLEELEKTFLQDFSRQKEERRYLPILKKIKKTEGDISLRLLSFILNSLEKKNNILGKSEEEMEKILQEYSFKEGDSSLDKKKSQRYGSSIRKKQQKQKFKRGIKRGEIPNPSLKQIGSSRIVVRKLY